jgi:flavin reductase (DIM6/NTAB) family NADH-FMN oxidoreductase RutF
MSGSDSQITRVLGQFPAGAFILTAAHEQSRFGMLARWVQPCAIEPPMVMAAVERGNAIAPLIRDSRRFALCQIEPDDRQTIRRFSVHYEPDADPFVGVPLLELDQGPPVLAGAMSYIDCELARHVDIGGDHEIYVGLILEARILSDEPPRTAA